MSAPNRADVVKRLCEEHPEVFTIDRHDENRRAFLPQICGLLNSVDGTSVEPRPWGVLVKGDRTPEFIPCDIVVWRPSGEHVDVMTASGGTWVNHGPIALRDPRWRWASADVVAPDGSPTPRPLDVFVPPETPTRPGEFPETERFIEAIERLYDGLAGVAESNRAIERRLQRLSDEGVRIHL